MSNIFENSNACTSDNTQKISAAINFDSSRISPTNGRTIHEVIIDAKYLHLIRDGFKTIEGKVNKPKYDSIQKGDIIKFVSSSESLEKIFCRVEDRVFYPTFRDMLIKEGLENCLPGSASIEDGVAVYHSFPDYARDEQTYQVSAFKIIYISQELLGEVVK